MVRVEVHHFHGCPNSAEMIKRVREVITESKVEVEFSEVLVDTPEKAEKYKFRGSPTVLINGTDLEGLPEPVVGNLACRYYINGLLSVKSLVNFIKNGVNKKR